MKITVVLATYNGAEFISEQLNSICLQTKKPDEIVVCDDCSSDSTMEIVNEFKKKYDNISWIVSQNKLNIGFKKNFIKASDLATGDILFFSDQDDIWKKNKIEIMTNVFYKYNNCLAVSCAYTIFNGTTEYKTKNRRSNRGVELISLKKQVKMLLSPGMSLAVKKEVMVVLKNIILDEDISHDTIVGLYSSLKNGFYVVNQSLVLYRVHEKNTSNPSLDISDRLNNIEKFIEGRLNRIILYTVCLEYFELSRVERKQLKSELERIKSSIKFLNQKRSLLLFRQIFTINRFSNHKISLFMWFLSLQLKLVNKQSN